MAYIHPGKLFTSVHGQPRSLDIVRAYAAFLREQAGLTQADALDFRLLRDHFGIPEPKRVKLPGQQGLLLKSEAGIIVINETDSTSRQRYTEAHEFMEILFSADEEHAGWSARQTFGCTHSVKEIWCDAGAAELLMPRQKVEHYISSQGVSFETARFLAITFETSLLASLRQMVNASAEWHAVVLWQMRHTKQQQQTIASQDFQPTLFAPLDNDLLPQKKLRVAWRQQNVEDPFIPFNKSIAEPSSVHTTYRDRVFTKGSERIEFDRMVIRFFAENLPYRCDDEDAVLSLLKLSN